VIVFAGSAVAGLALVWVILALAFGHSPFSLAAMEELSRQTSKISRTAYLATQLPILWTYIRLFFWPSGLHLDYAGRALDGFAHPKVWIALAGHLALVGLALWTWRRRPMIAFGVLFYYLAHAIESSVLPIWELAFEHRTYLPNLGLCLVSGWLLLVELPRWIGGSRVAAALAVLVLLVLGVVTWQRNELWRDPVAFWRDNARLAPGQARVWGNLGKHLIESGQPEEAVRALEESMRLQKSDDRALGIEPLDVVNLIVALQMLHRDEEAMKLIERFAEEPMEPFVRAKFYLNRGNIQAARRRYPEAEASFRRALELFPDGLAAQANLASVLAQMGRAAEAETLYEAVLRFDPDDRDTRENLLQVRAVRLILEGDDHARAGRRARMIEAYRGALAAFEEVLRLDPDNSSARANMEKVRRAIVHPPLGPIAPIH
jgi:tetratricopeptide (TPR) repeat protein